VEEAVRVELVPLQYHFWLPAVAVVAEARVLVVLVVVIMALLVIQTVLAVDVLQVVEVLRLQVVPQV
jgi:hypothetical protein